MDQIKIGRFIAESRKKVKLTQIQLASGGGKTKKEICHYNSMTWLHQIFLI